MVSNVVSKQDRESSRIAVWRFYQDGSKLIFYHNGCELIFYHNERKLIFYQDGSVFYGDSTKTEVCGDLSWQYLFIILIY